MSDEKKECRPESHVFTEADGGVPLTEGGESATCLCDSIAVRLENGEVKITVRASFVNERINVSILPMRQVLQPTDTLSVSLPKETPHD